MIKIRDISLKVKMMSLISLVVIVATIAIAAAFVSNNKKHIQNEFDIRIKSVVDTAAKNLELSVMIKQLDEIQRMQKSMLNTPDLVSVSVYDANDELLSRLENKDYLPSKVKRIHQEIIVEEVLMDELQIIEGDYSVGTTEVVGRIVALFSIKRMEHDLNKVIVFSFQLTFIVIIFAILIGYYLATALTKPLAQLVCATQKVAEGDLSYTATNYSGDEIGHLSYSFGIMVSELANDIDRREKIERQLRESNLRFQSLANKAPVGILQFDTVGKCIFVNPRGLEILGVSENSILAHNWLNRIHPDDYDRVAHEWLSFITQQSTFYSEFRFGDSIDEKIWVIGEAYPEFNDMDKISGYIGTIIDVTPLKLITEELKRSNDELDGFARIASHDLKEPMRKIQSFGSILEEDFADALGESGQVYLDRVMNAAQRMQSLIDGLLAYSQVATKAKPLCRLNLNEVIEEVIFDLEVAVDQSGGKISVSDLPEIRGDHLQMRQLMQNLIGNSLKYYRENIPPIIKISSHIKNDMLEVTVSDNGIGFDMHHVSKMFGVFERLHGRSSKYEGTGVGLSICKKIVERHGGIIHAHGKCGEGAQFVFTLPLCKDELNV